MNIENISLGRYAPGVVNVIIETPRGSRNKYRYDPKRKRFVVEYKLDGSFLGLSGGLRVDAISPMGVVLDLKTGSRTSFQELYTTGYALVLEALYEVPYDVGCLVNLDFSPHGTPIIKRWFHMIDEPLRQQFIEERDEKMRIVAEQEDPGVPERCPRDCSFIDVCGARR